MASSASSPRRPGYAGRIDAPRGDPIGGLEPEETSSGHRLHYVGIVYRATVTGGSLRDEPDGSTDHAEWVPLDRARRAADSSTSSRGHAQRVGR